MSKIKKVGLDQYGPEHFGRLIFATVRKMWKRKGIIEHQLDPCNKGKLKFLVIINEKTRQFTTSYKHDGSKIAELKQQISQKHDISWQHSGISAMCCEVISSFVIFAAICYRHKRRRNFRGGRGPVPSHFFILRSVTDVLQALFVTVNQSIDQ